MLELFDALLETAGQLGTRRFLEKCGKFFSERLAVFRERRLLRGLSLQVCLQGLLEVFRLAATDPFSQLDSRLQVSRLAVGEACRGLGELECLLCAGVLGEELVHLREDCLLPRERICRSLPARAFPGFAA